MNWLPLFAMYGAFFAYLAIISRINTIEHTRRMKRELELQLEKERHLQRWRMFLLFMKDCHEAKESMLEIMWMNKCSKEESAVDRINQELLNL